MAFTTFYFKCVAHNFNRLVKQVHIGKKCLLHLFIKKKHFNYQFINGLTFLLFLPVLVLIQVMNQIHVLVYTNYLKNAIQRNPDLREHNSSFTNEECLHSYIIFSGIEYILVFVRLNGTYYFINFYSIVVTIDYSSFPKYFFLAQQKTATFIFLFLTVVQQNAFAVVLLVPPFDRK